MLLDHAVLHISLVNHFGPSHELVIRSSRRVFILFPNFPLLFHLLRVHRLLSAFCSGTCPSLLAPVSPPFSTKSLNTRRRTPIHSPRHLPLWLFSSSAENFAALLLPRLFASVDSAADSYLSFVSSSESDGACRVSLSGSGGASRVSSSGSDSASRVSSSGSDGASHVSSS